MLRIKKAAGDCGDQSAEEKNSTTYFFNPRNISNISEIFRIYAR
jgi:hypothetical protein